MRLSPCNPQPKSKAEVCRSMIRAGFNTRQAAKFAEIDERYAYRIKHRMNSITVPATLPRQMAELRERVAYLEYVLRSNERTSEQRISAG